MHSPETDSEMEVGMPETVGESPPVEEREEKEAELAKERSWIVMLFLSPALGEALMLN